MTDLVKTREASWVRQLKSAKNRAQHELVAFGKLLAQCRKAVPHGSWQNVLDEIGMSRVSAHRLMTIVENPVLANVSHEEHLPRDTNTLGTLARLSKPELEACIADGRVHAGMKRADAEALVPKKTPTMSEMWTADQQRKQLAKSSAPDPNQAADGGDGVPAPVTPTVERDAPNREDGEPATRMGPASVPPPVGERDADGSESSISPSSDDSEPVVSGRVGVEPSVPRTAAAPPTRPSNGKTKERYEHGSRLVGLVTYAATETALYERTTVEVYLAAHPEEAGRVNEAAKKLHDLTGWVVALTAGCS